MTKAKKVWIPALPLVAALLHGSKKVPYVILAKGGNLENNSHPEFISGYLELDAETSSA
ncbi:hypothetical protein [Rickettsia endosymbiont of Orchestes rusci]|uniref:hypothetical protein n=1 Tax=Rickettsia endosymbiont of Orchestes rusci TaxID=3066250 RepID=UPI00313C628D